LTEIQAWPAERTVRATTLRYLLVEDRWLRRGSDYYGSSYSAFDLAPRAVS
jgi:hypothetical protein